MKYLTALIASLVSSAALAGPITFVDGTAAFSAAHQGGGHEFTDEYTFTLSKDYNASAQVSSISLSSSREWDFTSVILKSLTAGEEFKFEPVVTGSAIIELLSLGPVKLESDDYVLEVSGRVPSYAVSGSYGGNINITPASVVPEPASVALVLLGLGALALQRKK